MNEPKKHRYGFHTKIWCVFCWLVAITVHEATILGLICASYQNSTDWCPILNARCWWNCIPSHVLIIHTSNEKEKNCMFKNLCHCDDVSVTSYKVIHNDISVTSKLYFIALPTSSFSFTRMLRKSSSSHFAFAEKVVNCWLFWVVSGSKVTRKQRTTRRAVKQ